MKRRTKAEKRQLKERASVMRGEGHTYEVIAEVLGISPATASIYVFDTAGLAIATAPATKSLPSGAERARARAEMSTRIREEDEADERAERERWQEEAREEMEVCARLGQVPSWHPPSRQHKPVSPDADAAAEIERLVEQQAKDERMATAPGKRRFGWINSLDEPLRKKDNPDEPMPVTRGDALPSERDPDPFLVLTGATPENLQAVLGGIALEDVEHLPDEDLDRLRDRLLDAGISPPSVQASERERLRESLPHRGRAPSAPTGKKASRHRGRNEASDLMRYRGKKFKRRTGKRKRKDGWGALAA